MVESDALNAVQAINRNANFSQESLLLNDVRRLLLQVSNSPCCFIPRKGNEAAHLLARFALSCNDPLCWLEENPPLSLMLLLAI